MLFRSRFICISRRLRVFSDARKLSITFNVPHEAGSLNRILSRLAMAGVNVYKLESRPMPGLDGEYRFFVDLAGDLREPGMIDLMCELEARTQRFVFLGAYAER